MAKRKWILGTSAFLLVLLLLASYMAIAAETNSKEDPLVALSYLTDVLAPATIARVNDAIELKANEMMTVMNQTLTEFTTRLEQKISEFESRNENIATDTSFINTVTTKVLALMGGGSLPGSGGSTVASGWELVQVNSGQIYKFSTGGMILLRIGSATCWTDGAPGLIDCTGGSELDGNGALLKNHLYLVTVDGRGFKATADSKIMVYGSYKVE